MRDRTPAYPGRVKLVPVEGQDNVYDLTRADEPVDTGTPLNKATLLTDETAALYGLGAAANPTVDDIFAALGRYKMHWWRVQGASWQTKHDSVSVVEGDTYRYLSYGLTTGASNTIYYSDALSIDQTTGAVSLKNPASLTVSYSSADTDTIASKLSGKYVTGFRANCSASNPDGTEDGNVYLMDDDLDGDSGFSRVKYASGAYSVHTFTYRMTAVITTEFKADPDAEESFLQSTDEDAYPHSGTQDGAEYWYLGVPLDSAAIGAANIATGSYTGTGAYGASNPNEIVCAFTPRIVFIQGEASPYNNVPRYHILLWPLDEMNLSLNNPGTVTWSGTSVSWYNNSEYQLNNAGTLYSYIVLGR